MSWIPLDNISQLDSITEMSDGKTQIIFKHSTRCSISHMAKSRLERETMSEEYDWYFLDLIKYRDISNGIAEKFQVNHESPQILIIKKGECTFAESHNGIIMSEIVEQA